MAHLPPENLSAFEPFSQRKTLFTVAPGREAILVELLKHGKRRSRQLKFEDAHAALTWAMDHGAVFLLMPGSDPAAN